MQGPLRLSEPGPATGAPPPGERHLIAAVERLARAPHGWSATALHLSRLPMPRPHHRRVGRAMMQDAAQRGDGQVFSLRNGDLVLLARNETAGAPVVERLRALFSAEADIGTIASEWHLARDSGRVLAFAAEHLTQPETPVAEEAAPPPAEIVDALAAAIAEARPQDVLRRQVAVLFDPSGSASGATMRLAYRELTFSLATLTARLPPGPERWQGIVRDPTLMLHLGRALDRQIIEALNQNGPAPLNVLAQAGAPLHINLSVAVVLSEQFALLAAKCRAVGAALGIEIALIEAIADPSGFERASVRVREHGARVVLDGVSHHALLLTRPALLRADLLKLDWSPHMARLAPDEQVALARALDTNTAQVVLHRAETEAAMRWGLAHRIRLFQGWHVDQILAVQRMLGCPNASGCMLRQCIVRAEATGADSRAGCLNLPLLDEGLPTTEVRA